MEIMLGVVIFFLFILLAFMLAMAHAACVEHARRGFFLSVAGVVLLGGTMAFLVLYRESPVSIYMLTALFWFFIVFVVISLIPRFPALPEDSPGNVEPFDERHHMFARGNLKYHPELGKRYHKLFPEKKPVDEEIWKLPELGAPGSKFYDRYVGSIADSAFAVLDRSYHPIDSGSPAPVPKSPPDPERMVEAVRIAAFQYGAVDVGITRLQRHHLYSFAGRQAENWGQPVVNTHKTAIVLVVPMSPDFIRLAPSLPVILESSRQYVESAKIAHIVSEMFRRQGVSATAHVDGHYQVICAPLAQAAGMGRVGRMGIFMHRVYGPSVRLSVVTVDLALPETTGNHDYMEHFCNICKKCADNCPGRAIPHGDKPISRGFAHWSVNQESCYGFWRKIGTDCAVCIRSCPFSKPDTFVHRIIRRYVRQNPLNQRLALLGDDLFYGRKVKIPSRNMKWRRLLAEVRNRR